MSVFAVVIPYEGVEGLFAKRESAEAFIVEHKIEEFAYIEEMPIL